MKIQKRNQCEKRCFKTLSAIETSQDSAYFLHHTQLQVVTPIKLQKSHPKKIQMGKLLFDQEVYMGDLYVLVQATGFKYHSSRLLIQVPYMKIRNIQTKVLNDNLAIQRTNIKVINMSNHFSQQSNGLTGKQLMLYITTICLRDIIFQRKRIIEMEEKLLLIRLIL